MKKYIIILLVAFIDMNCKAQSPVIDIYGKGGTRMTGAYYKDVNNILGQFEGTYVYSNGNQYFKIILVKKTMQHIANRYYEDLIIGEYQYINPSGVQQVNTLNEIDNVYFNQNQHNISGNGIRENDSSPPCPECPAGEKRLYLGFMDNYPGFMVVRKIMVNGQEAISFFKADIGPHEHTAGDPPNLPPQVPFGNYTLLKQ